MALYLPRMRSGEGLDPDPAARIGEMNEKSRSNCGTLSLIRPRVSEPTFDALSDVVAKDVDLQSALR